MRGIGVWLLDMQKQLFALGNVFVLLLYMKLLPLWLPQTQFVKQTWLEHTNAHRNVDCLGKGGSPPSGS